MHGSSMGSGELHHLRCPCRYGSRVAHHATGPPCPRGGGIHKYLIILEASPCTHPNPYRKRLLAPPFFHGMSRTYLDLSYYNRCVCLHCLQAQTVFTTLHPWPGRAEQSYTHTHSHTQSQSHTHTHTHTWGAWPCIKHVLLFTCY